MEGDNSLKTIHQITNIKVTPFLDVKAGASVLTADEIDGTSTCTFVSPGLGVSIGLREKMSLNVLFSYDLHAFEAEVYDYYSGWNTQSLYIDGPAIKVGLEW